jgi:signal transduction histidine kinase
MNTASSSLGQKTGRVQISHVALGNVALAFAAIAFVSFSASCLVAYFGNVRYQPGLIAMIAGVCFVAVLASVVSFKGHRVIAYILLCFAICMLMINGAFIAGYGVHAPALVLGLIPFSLSSAVFGRKAGLFWSSPVIVVWGVVFALQFSGVYVPDPMTPKPLPVNILLNLFGTLVAIGYVNTLFNRRTDEAFESEEAESRAVARELQLQRTLQSERDRFMGELSHEIRTPVAALRNAVALIKHPKASPAMKDRYIDVVDVTSASLLSLLNDVMDSFRYGNQSFRLNNTLLDIRVLIEEIEALFLPVAQQKGLAFQSDLSAVTTSVISGDGMRLRQMLSNLVGNAIKFTDNGRVTVRVIPPENEHRPLWRFEVSDTGCGIPANVQAALFAPFSQVHGVERAQAAGGSGLGLSIVRQLAQAMGGGVGVTSSLGEGSTFWFEAQMFIAMPSIVPDGLASRPSERLG